MLDNKEKIWSLFDQIEQHQVDELSIYDVHTILRSVVPRRRKDWLAWRVGESQWKSISEFAELKIFQMTPPPPSQLVNNFSEITKTASRISHNMFNPETTSELNEAIPLDMDESTGSDRRSLSRFTREFEVKVQESTKTFETTTIDVSLDGLHLKKPVPSWAGSVFKLTLEKSGEKVELICELIKGKKSTALKIKENNQLDLYRKWILG